MREWTGWFTADCQGQIPINEKLLQAFQKNPGLAQTLRRFNSTGHVSGRGRVERHDPHAADASFHHEIRIHQANLRYDSFPYTFYNVNGLVVIENDKTVFRDISGINNNGEVVCNGTWTRGGQLELFFFGPDNPP